MYKIIFLLTFISCAKRTPPMPKTKGYVTKTEYIVNFGDYLIVVNQVTYDSLGHQKNFKPFQIQRIK